MKKVFSRIGDIVRNIDSNSTIVVDGFVENDDKAIVINNPFFGALYAVELSTASNIMNYMDKDSIDSLHRKYKYSKDGFLFWSLVKKGNFQKNYVLSYNRSIIEYVAQYYGTKMIDGIDLLNVLYDLQLDNQYIINKDKKCLERKLDLTKNVNYEFLNYTYNNLVKDSVFKNLSTMNLYQATHFKSTDKPTDVSRLFGLNFKGIIWSYISFNKSTAITICKDWIGSAKAGMTNEKRELDIFKEEIASGGTDAISINTVMLIDKETDSEFMNSSIGECLNVVFKKDKDHKWGRKKIIKYTPLIHRNNIWTQPVPKDFLYNYIASVHKKDSPNAQMIGNDINGATINYNLKHTTFTKANTRPHFFIGGKTGSTKTTFVNRMLSMMIDFDWDTNKVGDTKKIKIRQFDIKKSLKPYAQYVEKHNPGTVSFLETDLNEFSYNLINIAENENGTLDQNDLSFCKNTTSFILWSKDSTQDASLTYDEGSLYGRLIEEVYREKSHEDITIEELSRYQHGLAQELIALGYSMDNYLHDITEDEFIFLKKPTLEAVVKKLDQMTKKGEIVEDEMQLGTVQALRKKISTICDLGAKSVDGVRVPGYFARYERMNIDSSKQWLLFDMDKIKELDEYAPIQWILLSKIAHDDMKEQIKLREAGLPEPDIIYLIEEAHNMFSNPLFRSTDEKPGILDKQAKEWRSYNMILGPISQESHHIPKEVFDSIETKFFLFPEVSEDDSGEGVDKQVSEIKKLLGLSDKVERLLLNTPRYHACAINEHGAFVIGLPTTDHMRKVFDGKTTVNIE